MHLFKCSSTQKFAEIIVYNFFISDIGDYYILYILDCSRGAPGINIRLQIFSIINF